ncbi:MULTISPECIES: ABC transporter permease [Frankia]|uniref:Transport permease protein n=1 Tax=Frankia alni (strain DSM 45986 / CECT 9034 / ACN14a) TaxID=326424 RepID=Q0RMQ0_FRAAA|nr:MULTISPECIES: ABC transporter permease [Frankia]CAJ61197.1 ABC transporter system integral membrane protein [Frankia alni ACN14a]
MSTLSMPLTDSTIMLRRNLKHTLRNPVVVFQAVLFPAVIMFLFVHVFGGAFDVGGKYIDYATPGVLVMACSYGLGSTAAAVNSDMTKGIINRFKAMDVSRGSVLTGHVVITTVRSLMAVAVVIGVAFAMGFRSSASALDWLGVLGLAVLLSLAAGWFTVGLGLAAKTAESAGLASVPLVMLPYISSAFVPAHSMGVGVRQFAQYQPFTPIIETLRGLLEGNPSSSHAIAAVAWCVGFALIGYVWAVTTFNKRA